MPDGKFRFFPDFRNTLAINILIRKKVFRVKH